MQRKTLQRETIIDVLESADRPLSPGQIYELAKQRLDRLGIATVYRTIKGLLADDRLTAVDVPGEPPRYEIAGKPHHHHFHCEACGQVFEVPKCPKSLRDLRLPGFRITGHLLTIFGTCPGCLA